MSRIRAALFALIGSAVTQTACGGAAVQLLRSLPGSISSADSSFVGLDFDDGFGQFGGASNGFGGGQVEPIGSCCLPSGGCLTITASDCAVYFGVYYGPALLCGIAPCEQGF